MQRYNTVEEITAFMQGFTESFSKEDQGKKNLLSQRKPTTIWQRAEATAAAKAEAVAEAGAAVAKAKAVLEAAACEKAMEALERAFVGSCGSCTLQKQQEQKQSAPVFEAVAE